MIVDQINASNLPELHFSLDGALDYWAYMAIKIYKVIYEENLYSLQKKIDYQVHFYIYFHGRDYRTFAEIF